MGSARISPEAERDRDAHAEFIARESPDTALRFLLAARTTFAFLAANPDIGRPRHFSNPALHDLRSWSIDGFRRLLVF